MEPDPGYPEFMPARLRTPEKPKKVKKGKNKAAVAPAKEPSEEDILKRPPVILSTGSGVKDSTEKKKVEILPKSVAKARVKMVEKKPAENEEGGGKNVKTEKEIQDEMTARVNYWVAPLFKVAQDALLEAKGASEWSPLWSMMMYDSLTRSGFEFPKDMMTSIENIQVAILAMETRTIDSEIVRIQDLQTESFVGILW